MDVTEGEGEIFSKQAYALWPDAPCCPGYSWTPDTESQAILYSNDEEATAYVFLSASFLWSNWSRC